MYVWKIIFFAFAFKRLFKAHTTKKRKITFKKVVQSD